jgi:hypothetical protein
MSEPEFRCHSYPCIKSYIGGMLHNRGDLCVLFTSPRTGICLVDKINNRVGEYNNDWREVLFVLYEEDMIVSNKIIWSKRYEK